MRKLARQVVVFVFLTVMFFFPGFAIAGYTHYWQWIGQPDPVALKACISDMRKIIEAGGNIVAGPDGSGAPVIGEAEVSFNGAGADAHETFSFPGQPGFNFCKTVMKPYDRVVVACLLAAATHFQPTELRISSDGRWDAGDWNAGARLYSTVLKQSPHNPLEQPHVPRRDAGGFMLMEFLSEFSPWISIIILVIFIVVMKRSNLGKHVVKQREYMAKSEAHMQAVQSLLTRIAEAVEKQQEKR